MVFHCQRAHAATHDAEGACVHACADLWRGQRQHEAVQEVHPQRAQHAAHRVIAAARQQLGHKQQAHKAAHEACTHRAHAPAHVEQGDNKVGTLCNARAYTDARRSPPA